jgi:micrococcal nuclease
MKITLIAFLAILSTACSNIDEQASDGHLINEVVAKKVLNENYYSILRFVDGDTYWVNDGSPKGVKVRLIGINSPEPRSYFKMKEERFGKEASAFMEKLVGSKQIRLELDVQEIDQFGRVLAYCYFKDGRMINEEMVKNGFAQVATYPPNVKYQDMFIVAQKYAREHRLGMWE